MFSMAKRSTPREKFKHRDLMVRPVHKKVQKSLLKKFGVPKFAGEKKMKVYQNNAGEHFLVANTPSGVAHRKLLVFFSGKKKKPLQAYSKLTFDGKSVCIGNTEKVEELLTNGKPKKEFKGRYLFRIFLNEAIGFAKQKKTKLISLDTPHEGVRDYLKGFGFRFLSKKRAGISYHGVLALTPKNLRAIESSKSKGKKKN